MLAAAPFAQPTDPRLELAEAAEVFRLGLGASKHLDDVPLRLSFLEALLGCHGLDDRAELEQERAKLLRESLYVPLLRARQLPVDPVALAAPVFGELYAKLRLVALGEAGSTRGLA